MLIKTIAQRIRRVELREGHVAEVSWWWRLVELLPFVVPIFIASFGLLLVVLLLIGLLVNWLIILLVLPFSIYLSIVAARWLPRMLPGELRERRVAGVIILFGVVGWSLFNMQYVTEDIYVNRDPGLYHVTAMWLMNHDNLWIEASDGFSADEAMPDSAGFGQIGNDDRLYAQAPHLLPVLLGLTGRIGGESSIMALNIIFGGAALLSVYGMCRLFLRPKWALLGTAVLSISLPMIYFSRDTYTEPLAMMLVFGALAAFFVAEKASRDTSNPWPWFIAGVMAASSVLVRIDGYLVIASFILAFFTTEYVRGRRYTQSQTIGFFLGLGVTSLIGFIDLFTLSRKYLNDLSSQFIAQIALITLIALIGYTYPRILNRLTFITRWYHTYRKKILIALLLLIAAFFMLLASRPLWLEGHETGNQFSIAYVKSLQLKDGSEVDVNRTYEEYSLYWVTWYIGPLIIAFALVGLAVCFYAIIMRKKTYLLPFVLLLIPTAVVYFLRPSITPDQIWAIRRYVPVIIPCLVILAMIGVETLSTMVSFRVRRRVLGAVILLFFVPVVFISLPFITHKELAGQSKQIEEVCGRLPQNAALLLAGQQSMNAIQTLRSYCQVPVERAEGLTTEKLSTLAKGARDKGFTPLVVVFVAQDGLLPKGTQLARISSISVTEMTRELNHPPRRVDTLTRSIDIGIITKEGRIIAYEKDRNYK